MNEEFVLHVHAVDFHYMDGFNIRTQRKINLSKVDEIFDAIFHDILSVLGI